MSRRSFLTGLLLNNAELQAYVGDRVFQGLSMKSVANLPKPYIVYHIGNTSDEVLAENHSAARHFFQIYVYDHLGDLQRIDDIIKAVKKALVGRGSEAEKIITIRFLGTSQDLDDNTMGAAFRYARFQMIASGD